MISWDIFGYYLYLPATFLHHDIGLHDFSWVQHILDTYHPTAGFYQAYPGPEGAYVMKYPMGLALLYLPFFFAGHVAAWLSGMPADGFSMPYQVAIAFGSVVYAIIGLWYLRKMLLHFFNEKVTSLCLIILVGATNYLHLTAFDGAMPHNYLFTLFALVGWLTIRWHTEPRARYIILIGVLSGLAILIRPTSGWIILIPLLWVPDRWKEKLKLIRLHPVQILVAVAGLAMVVSLQLIYWRWVTGHWFYYSYEKNEKLQWLAPYLREVLFSYRKGWLVYSPVMIFALAGFIPMVFKLRSVFPAVVLFFICYLLTVSSWPTWWYGGSFGQRVLMETYVFLALPLGAWVDWMIRRKWVIKIPVLLVIALMTVLSLFQTWQYYHFILDASRMTKATYWRIFGQTRYNGEDQCYLIPPESITEYDSIPKTRGGVRS